jgi:hypothetical protein
MASRLSHQSKTPSCISTEARREGVILHSYRCETSNPTNLYWFMCIFFPPISSLILFILSCNFTSLFDGWKPVTVAERSKPWTIFARADSGTVGSNPTQVMNVQYLCWVCVFLCLCTGIGLGDELILSLRSPTGWPRYSNWSETEAVKAWIGP